MNTVCLMGRLTDDITLRQTTGGLSVCNFTLAVPNHKKKDGEADFIRCQAWSSLAERMEKYVGKGCQITVEGRLSTGSYTNKDGNKVNTMDVVCMNVTFITFKNSKKNEMDGFENLAEDLDDLFGGE